MQKNTYKLLTEKFNISEKVLDLINRSENLVKDTFDELDDIMAYNQYKVLDGTRATDTTIREGTPSRRYMQTYSTRRLHWYVLSS